MVMIFYNFAVLWFAMVITLVFRYLQVNLNKKIALNQRTIKMFSLVSSISVIHIIWWTVNALSLVLIFLGSRKNIKYIDYKKKINGKEYLRDTGIAVLLIYFAIFIFLSCKYS